MNNSKPLIHSLGHAVLAVLYVICVAQVMQWASMHITAPGILGIVGVLLLLTVSVAIMGVLIFGRPAYLIVTGNRKEGLEFLATTLIFLVVIMLVLFIGLYGYSKMNRALMDYPVTSQLQ